MTDYNIPETAYAVQLVGPSKLELNTAKPIPTVGPTQILIHIETTGLCFSDLKLLKQFTGHVRKSEIVSGIDPAVLADIPSYVPGDKPGVPGHEAVGVIEVVGDSVTRFKVGQRVLVQADYRELKTANSNGAFGYNFEGGLQEYTLADERVVIDPVSNESFMIPAREDLSASAIALVEPWACVEDSYVTPERNCIKADGQLLVVCEEGFEANGIVEAYSPDGPPHKMVTKCSCDIDKLDDFYFDDIVYFGANKETVEKLNDKLAACGTFNVVTCGNRFGEGVSIDVGRVHYGLTRWTGTNSSNAADAYKHIPQTGELRDGDDVLIVGAGGPMGQMHVIRDVCTGHKDISLVATDFDTPRLDSLEQKAKPLAESNGVQLRMVNPQDTPLDEKFSYIGLMAPVPALVGKAIADSVERCRINIFAGIPAGTRTELDLDTYIANKCWMFGTSGSTIADMKMVLAKVESGQLDTNTSVDAVAGMAGAIDGIAAVENRTLAGKIMVYPELHEMGMIPLTELDKHYPTVAAKLVNGIWNRDAECELLKVAK